MNNNKEDNKKILQNDSEAPAEELATEAPTTETLPKEIGGRTQGLEPTRFGDWEYKGRCVDF